jgi:rod shape-determining protein MreC
MQPFKHQANYKLRFSRKSVFTFFFLLVVLFLVAYGLHRTHPKLLPNWLYDITLSVHETVEMVTSSTKQYIDGLQNIPHLIEENKNLKNEQRQLLKWKHIAYQMEAENKALKQLLKAVDHLKLNYVTAKIISTTYTDFMRKIWINIGESEGIKKGQAVLGDNGIIGRVHEVTGQYSEVILLTDPQLRLPVRTKNGEMAITKGEDDYLRLSLKASNKQISEGEEFVTVADGNGLPSGFYVGQAKRSVDGKIIIEPSFDKFALDYIIVLIDQPND